jgi:acyl-coenzyme A synthetase/AMP-(fatty) acid ligase
MSADDAVIWRAAGAPLTRGEFLREAAGIATRLPRRAYLVNLCEQRENFLLAFAAARFANQVQLMPAARGDAALAELNEDYPNSHAVRDDDLRRLRSGGPAEPARELTPEDPESLVLVGFTSGSTGKSQPHAKRWRALEASARLNAASMREALGVPARTPLSIIGTVPPHHMYGIEMTVLLPLFANASVHAERPLFPADVAATLAAPDGPRVLVSTPLHLRALAESGAVFPPLDLIVSATAPLDPALARTVEKTLGAPLLEMFGSTETCVFGTRRTAQQSEWGVYDGVELTAEDGCTRVSAPWYAQAQLLQDVLEKRGTHGFVALGRNSDLVEVAGKRASLADITRRLIAVPGVADAVAFQPDVAPAGVPNRVAAVVVSPGVTARQITETLAIELDAVFLPRPLVLVDRIPRDAVGKVSRAHLLELTRSEAG